jgi:hypothetical protein
VAGEGKEDIVKGWPAQQNVADFNALHVKGAYCADQHS